MVWIVTRSNVFVGVVLRIGIRFELMVSCVVKAVAYVLRVNVSACKLLDGKPQACLSTGCKIACVRYRRLQDST